MIIEPFKPFGGQHCETTATGSLLAQLGIELSEPMLFGVGEGLGYIYWNMKTMDFPFIGGRIKPDALTQNIAAHLGLALDVRETGSAKKAWENVQGSIDRGIAVGLKLDSYHLEYFKEKIHFAGHYVAMYGYDNEDAYLVDTLQSGGKVKTSLASLEAARKGRGPMSSKSLSYTLGKTGRGYDLKNVVLSAIHGNAEDYLNPPIANIGYRGILKTSTEIKKWFKTSRDVRRDFTTTAMIMEQGGTGGALFRNLYGEFLKESYELLGSEELQGAHRMFLTCAKSWTEVSALFQKAGETGNIGPIDEASRILAGLSEREKKAMELLYGMS